MACLRMGRGGDGDEERGDPAGESAVSGEFRTGEIEQAAEKKRGGESEPEELPAGDAAQEEQEHSQGGEVGDEMSASEVNEVAGEEAPEFAGGQSIAGADEEAGIGGAE